MVPELVYKENSPGSVPPVRRPLRVAVFFLLNFPFLVNMKQEKVSAEHKT